MNCFPKTCDDLQERIAILEAENEVNNYLFSDAINQVCKDCSDRTQRGAIILKRLKGE